MPADKCENVLLVKTLNELNGSNGKKVFLDELWIYQLRNSFTDTVLLSYFIQRACYITSPPPVKKKTQTSPHSALVCLVGGCTVSKWGQHFDDILQSGISRRQGIYDYDFTGENI